MGGRGVIAIITWIVATLIIVSLAWVAVSRAVAGIADPIPNIMGHGRAGAPRVLRGSSALIPVLDDTRKVDLSQWAGSAVGAATTVLAGATATAPSTSGLSLPRAVDGATGVQQSAAPATSNPTPAGGHGAGSVSVAQPSTPKSGPPRGGGHGAGGANGAQPGGGVVPTPEPTTPTATGTVKKSGSPGNRIAVRCVGDSIAVVSATPQGGYSTKLRDTGPDNSNVNSVTSSQERDLQFGC